MVTKEVGQRAAKLFGVLRMGQHKRALNVRSAVAAAGQFEVPLADGPPRLQQLQNFVALDHPIAPMAAVAIRASGGVA